MKKSILTLVLASLALPAIAGLGSFTEVLSVDKQNKINTAIATLEGYGINHTIVADNISDKLDLGYSWGNVAWLDPLSDALENKLGTVGDLIINPGNNAAWESNISSSYGGGDYKSFRFNVKRTNNSGADATMFFEKFVPSYGSFNNPEYLKINGIKYYNSISHENIEGLVEDYYDNTVGGLDSRGVHQESDKVLESLSGDIGKLIVKNGSNLKSVIKNIGYQIAAGEVGKSLSANCVGPEGEIYSIGACANIGSTFLDINAKVSKIIADTTGFRVQGATHTGNNGFYSNIGEINSYINSRGVEVSITPYIGYQKLDDDGEGYGDIKSESSLNSLGGTVTEGNLLGTYASSLDIISDLSGTLSDIAGDSSTDQVITRYRVSDDSTNIWVRDLDTDVSSWNPIWGDAYKRVFYNTDGTVSRYAGQGTKESVLVNSGIYGAWEVTKVGSDRDITFSDVDFSI